jgi:thiol:disulfide interchange protein DsbD
MFASVAAGMSAPYLLLTWQPGWMRFLPKPGNWMVRLKQAMGFLLLGTVVWLFGVLASLQGVAGVTEAAWFLLGLSAACWIFGTWIRPGARTCQQFLAWVGIVIVLVVTFGLSRPASTTESAEWQPWSPERVAELQKQGRPVFIDFTADWCLNCKYNERFVLDTKPVKKALQNVVKLRADWTKGDPAITSELKRIGRAGVPAYVVYPAKGGEPKVLPEILTQNSVLTALDEAR